MPLLTTSHVLSHHHPRSLRFRPSRSQGLQLCPPRNRVTRNDENRLFSRKTRIKSSLFAIPFTKCHQKRKSYRLCCHSLPCRLFACTCRWSRKASIWSIWQNGHGDENLCPLEFQKKEESYLDCYWRGCQRSRYPLGKLCHSLWLSKQQPNLCTS